jgi:GT2 family glycosyltransferase
MLSLDDPGRIDDAGDGLAWTGAAEKLGHGEPAHRFTQRSEVFSVCAGAALYRRTFLDAVGGFDERFFAYLEDVDLGLRGRLLGYRYLFEPAAEVLHKGHGSALPRADYVRLSTRNRVMLFAKSMPGSLLLKHLPRLLYGQLYFAIVYRRPGASLAGYVSLVPCLAHIWRERRRARASRRLHVAEIDGLLTTRMREPPLRLLLRRQLGRLRP